jgi:hypothetical protein
MVRVLLRSLLLMRQAKHHTGEARLAMGFLAELRRRGLLDSHRPRH